MSMRGRAGRAGDLTICEVLRQVNDLHQEKTRHDRQVRCWLAECEYRAKAISKALRRHSMRAMAGWWAANPGYAASLRRQESTYLCGRCPAARRDAPRSLQDALGVLKAVISGDSQPGRLQQAARLVGEAQVMAARMQAKLEEYGNKGQD